MASKSARKEAVSTPQGSRRRSASVRFSLSPNASTRQVTAVEERSFTKSILKNSSFNSSLADYTCDESFDVLPKTDYTYARSGSYSPRHLNRKYANPNMSRHRLRGMVTPPVSMLEDSDSDTEFVNQVEMDEEIKVYQHSENSTATGNRSFSNSSAGYSASYHQSVERDELDFDSDEADNVVSDRVNIRTPQMDQKERAEIENRIIKNSHNSPDARYRHYYDGMVLRSGSHLKGVKRYLGAQDSSRRKSTSVLGQHTGSRTAEVQTSLSAEELNKSRRWSEGISSQTTTITRTVTEIEEETLNMNNNARKSASELEEDLMDINNSARGRRSTRGRSTSRGRKYRYDGEDKRMRDEYQREKDSHRLEHLYGLDYSDEFSDSDSYTTDSSSVKIEGRFSYHTPATFFYKLFRKTVRFTRTVCRFLMFPLWVTYVKGCAMGRKVSQWIWKKIVHFVSYFILLDTWILSRRALRSCCMFLPLLLLLPFLAGTVYYGRNYLPSLPLSAIFARDEATHYEKVDTSQTVNLHQEIRNIILQLQKSDRQWLTKSEVEALIHGIVGPEMESVRVSLLNVANTGNSDQSSMKVDMQDAKMRLTTLEENLAILQARAKNLERELSDNREYADNNLAKEHERQTSAYADLQAALLTLQGQVDAMQGKINAYAAQTKRCCHNESATIALIRSQVNDIINEMLGGTDGKGGHGGALAGWLQQNYVDRSEFESQLRILTADITERISASMEPQRGSQGSSIVLPSGGDSLSEEAVRLIVEDALLKYSADRTGLPDYALESAGGSVISVRCSETYYKKTALVSIFGIPLWYTSNSPRTVIQPDVHPGQCWAFKGTSGYIVIQLSVPVRPTGFSLEHIPKSLSSTGSIDSAPREFTVFGLNSETDTVGVNLGNFTYQTVGKPIQYFEVQKRNPGVFEFVELRVLSNHGNKEYTCLYRFRVHGVPQQR